MEGLVHYEDYVTDSARWRMFRHRPGDVVVSTAPSSGTTLTQMLCALVIFDGPELPGALDDVSPWIDMRTRSEVEILDELDAIGHRRVIKTHTPLDGIPAWPDVRYLCTFRDPRDVFVAWQYHRANIDGERLAEVVERAVGTDVVAKFRERTPAAIDDRFAQWLDGDQHRLMSLPAIARHLRVAWSRRAQPNVHLLHYAALTGDLASALSTVGRALGVSVERDRALELAPHATLDAMRTRSASLAPNTKGVFRSTERFFRTGGHGEWREFLTPELVDRYRRRIDELMTAEQAAWIHSSPF